MKYLYYLCLLIVISACNKEWEEELFTKYVAFGKNGVVQVYVKYKEQGGNIPLKIPVVLSGSTTNNTDISISIALDKDTLTNLNFDRFRLREDLYFKELPAEYYSFKTLTATIPKGSNTGYVTVDLKLDGIDLVNKYILPLEIVSSSAYTPSILKHYKKSLITIIPFNDFSGRYSVAGAVWDRTKNENGQTALTTPYRNTWVVNEKAVFFYAGVTEEEAVDRAGYKISATFNADSTVTLTSGNPAIHFVQQKGTYTVSKRMDEVQPYLEKTYTTVYLEYHYDDITNPAFPLKYRFAGSMVLEKVKNIQIPEEEQQVQIPD
ncbi:DUF4973 domain-containing protein [Chitinophaga sp. SYP-B3965]|uniref:DUF4973 domain-containing protein n=1 Tax=Chitinophaga sp. SYP-B3965 TaxID=2663120 RepID=UPI0015676993|nr:DUF4973 domain-containing protein [Chitinophaga sp. SYP-B3965]